MKTLVFAKRNLTEILRDPVTLIFCLALPLFLLVIFQQFNIPSDVYSLENFTPGIAIFSFGFITLFSGQLISKDRSTSFLVRLFASPLKTSNYILGYILSLIPIAIIQSFIFFIIACFMGLKIDVNIISTLLVLIPIAAMFVGLGILIGCSFNDKQNPAISSIVVQLIAFTSGMWFAIDSLGTVFKVICNILPFRYAVDLTRDCLTGNYDNILFPLIIVIIYTTITLILATIIFKKKMYSDNK